MDGRGPEGGEEDGEFFDQGSEGRLALALSAGSLE
jgi:hypothetical protein